jgi:hypothetical protein
MARLSTYDASQQMVVLDAAIAAGVAPDDAPEDVIGALIRVGLLDYEGKPTAAAIHYSELIGIV